MRLTKMVGSKHKNNGHSELLSNHLRCLAAIECASTQTLGLLDSSMRRFGSTNCLSFESFAEAKSFLTPLKSFTTRFVLLGYGSWTILVSDMRNENCESDASIISATAKCRAIALRAQENRRGFHIFVSGDRIRSVETELDYDR